MSDEHRQHRVPPIGEDEIEAFIDRRLALERQMEVEHFISDKPQIGARVLADQALIEELRERLAPIAAEPIPTRLRIATIAGKRRAIVRHRLKYALACGILVGVGMASGWAARGVSDGTFGSSASARVDTSEAAAAIAAHRVFVVEKAHPVEVAAAQQAHLVQWLSRRVGHPLTVPDLTAEGYQLMGGRVLPAGDRAAAQVMYENGAGHRLTVYIQSTQQPDTAFHFLQAQGFSAFSWIDGGLGFAMVGPMDRPDLLEIADSTYRQLMARKSNASVVSH